MTKKLMVGIAMMTIAISSCNETTDYLGTSLVSDIDRFVAVTDTFDVSTRSIYADSILSRSTYSYLGRIKDPETGSYISSDFMTQFTILEGEADAIFVPKDSVRSLDDQGQPIVDSCFVNIVINSYMGDSLTAMKLKMTEMAKPMGENVNYYTNFDPAEKGYLRKDGISKNKFYSIADLQQSDSVRNSRRQGAYYESISIPLNEEYKDQEGNTYKNYGTYLLRNFYAHPEYYKNSQTFVKKLCPGFYIQTVDGLGMMAEVQMTQLRLFYKHQHDTVTIADVKEFTGTEEVLQTTHFTNDRENIKRLAAIDTCTYIKAPDGIYTEVTLPVEEIKKGHENDTIMSAKIVLRKMNEISEFSEYLLMEPENLLMVMKDSLHTFFEERNLPNNITSYLATYNSSKNSYTFNNISGMINHMYNKANRSEGWNKVVLIPVQVTKTSASSSTATGSVASVNNELRVTSIRLVGGSRNKHEAVRMSVVYNKNE